MEETNLSNEEYRKEINLQMNELFDSLYRIIYKEVENKKDCMDINDKKIRKICDILKQLTDKTVTDYCNLLTKYENLENNYINLLKELEEINL